MKVLSTKSKVLAITFSILSLFLVSAALGQTITINSTSPSTFCANTSTPIAISFTATNYNGNSSRTFTAQLSNSFGSFSSPTIIGSTSFNPNNPPGGAGTISGSINQPAGIYQIRIIQNNPGNQGSTTSNLSCIAVFPTAPTITAPANTCASSFALPTVIPVSGFNVQYSIDGGAFSASPGSTTTPGCYTIQARYVLAAGCGGLPAGTAGPARCNASNTVSVVIFPEAPPAPTVNAGCGPITVTPPPTVAGFNIQYSFNDGATFGANNPPTAENCAGYRIRTRYVLAAACGSTPAGAASTNPACGASPATTRVIDTQAPVVATAEGADANIGCNPTAQQIEAAFTAPTFTDNCGAPTVEVTNTSSTSGCVRSTTRTWTATDACGNATMTSQTISYTVDTENPTVTNAEGADANIGCNPTQQEIDAAFDAPTFTDNCGNPTVTVANTSSTSGCVRSTTRTWTATDACNNMTAVSQTISYTVDTQAPTVTTAEGADENIGCNPTQQEISAAFDAPVFADNCGAPTVEVTTVHSGTGCAQSDTRTWTATDACGNATMTSQTISYTVDTQDPTVATAEGADANIGCNPTAQAIEAAFKAPTFTDNCGTPTVTVANTSSANGCARSTTRTWTATDACNNTTAVSQTISYTVDTEKPVISCPPALTFQCASQVPAPDLASVTATDNCGGTVRKEFVGDQISNKTCANRYTITRTYRATDACDNSSTCIQVITVNDNTAPVVQNCPSNITVAPTTLSGTVVNYTMPTATDNCGGNPSRDQTSGKPSGSTFPIGTTTNTFEFTDACGNKSYCTFTVTVTNPYCDNNPKNRKVYVCHEGKTICISVSALQDHLKHGDYLGACTARSNTPQASRQGNTQVSANAAVESFDVVFSPNPTTTSFNIKVESGSNEPINIRITDASGRVVNLIKGVQKSSPVKFGANYQRGIYFAQVVQGAKHKTVKLIKLN